MAKFDITKFAEALPDRTDLPDSGMTREIALGDILDNPRNFYPRPDNKALAALMESIQANGLLEPPTVVPAEDGKYRLISGHSRMAALRLLAANRDEAVAKQFSTVLCRVLPAMTEEQELCAVIEANRQRVKSNALLAQEAEKLKETYIRRKKAGEKFPVGLREWIAKEMQINATKVGNLQVIKKGLKVPGILARWESGELPEAAALEIARMDDEMQYRLLDWMIDNHRSYAIKDVQEFVKSREAGAQASEDEKYIELLTYMRDKPVTIPQGYHDGSGKAQIDAAEEAKLIPSNIREGITVLGVTGTMSGSEGMKPQAKSVTPTFASQEILPDEGYNCLSSVTVAAIPIAYADNPQGGKTVTIG